MISERVGLDLGGHLLDTAPNGAEVFYPRVPQKPHAVCPSVVTPPTAYEISNPTPFHPLCRPITGFSGTPLGAPLACEALGAMVTSRGAGSSARTSRTGGRLNGKFIPEPTPISSTLPSAAPMTRSR